MRKSGEENKVVKKTIGILLKRVDGPLVEWKCVSTGLIQGNFYEVYSSWTILRSTIIGIVHEFRRELLGGRLIFMAQSV